LPRRYAARNDGCAAGGDVAARERVKIHVNESYAIVLKCEQQKAFFNV
jgi:hypothetical protein